ncbi:MAG: DUF692 domain-containing protein [Rhizobiaceae bacterium]
MLHASNTRVGQHPVRFPARSLRPRAGAGFKAEHLAAILAEPQDVSFFEVHAENYMGKGGTPHAQLDRLRQDFALSVHGVGMSIGAHGPLDTLHLARFKAIVDRWEPALISEHLAWSTHDDIYYNDLLPPPYTAETLQRVCEHIDQFQSYIGRPILLENPSTYLLFEHSDMEEADFIRQIARRTGCGLLLDVNNVFVSATNHNYSPEHYLDMFPLENVGEIHLAGHATEQDSHGNPLLIDAHDRPVADGVWDLYRRVLSLTGPVPTLIEWDNDIPQWPVLVAEMAAANAILDSVAAEPLLGRRHA